MNEEQQSSVGKVAVELESVTKRYRESAVERAILSDCSISVPVGGVCLLQGPSGTGKTTVLNLIAGIQHPDEGEVRVYGTALSELTDSARTFLRRTRMGFIFQFFNLVTSLTVSENVRLPLTLNGVRGSDADAIIERWLKAVGLSDRKNANVAALSGGEQQRVAIARALVHGPRLILADEPTGNLDSARAKDVLDLLVQLVAAEGCTLILASHSADAVRVADQIVSLRSEQWAARD